MTSLLKKMRGDKKGWYKVSDLRPGVEIAVPRKSGSQTSNASSGSLTSSDVLWDEIVSIKPVGREQVYDIEVEGTHNFVGNGIFAHNTYVLRANTALAVEGEVNAGSFTVPIGSATGATSTSALGREIPSSVLTADGAGVDLFKLATYNLSAGQALVARIDETDVRVTSLETRVEALESGAVGSQTSTSSGSLTSSLASALQSFGVLIQNGIAQFNTLVFRQLVASKDADGTSSAGSVSILTGNTVAQVSNSLVLPSTKVFITFNSQIAGSWWVSDKTAGGFRVILSEAQATDVSFDYFLVQTEGQIATSTPSLQPTADSGQSPASSQQQADTTPPVITLLGDNPLHVSIGGLFTDPGISATDNSAGAITYKTFVDGIERPTSGLDTGSQTTHIITYSATDVKGNSATVTRAVIVGTEQVIGDRLQVIVDSTTTSDLLPTDSNAPVVTLNGDAAMQITAGDTFTDAGATASDDVDGDLTSSVVITGAVDTTTAGSYTLTYTATDSAGNVGSVSRLVTVVAVPESTSDATTTPTP